MRQQEEKEKGENVFSYILPVKWYIECKVRKRKNPFFESWGWWKRGVGNGYIDVSAKGGLLLKQGNSYKENVSI
ncbi:MAG: hypothetical protein ACK4TN_00050 [Brevinematales bacterium]